MLLLKNPGEKQVGILILLDWILTIFCWLDGNKDRVSNPRDFIIQYLCNTIYNHAYYITQIAVIAYQYI